MTRLLDRYIFQELLAPFGIAVGALSSVLLTKELLRLVELFVAKGVDLLSVMRVFVHLFPSFLVLTLPIAGIIASVTAFSRLSFDRELIAMRAAGASLVQLCRPVLVFATLLCGLTLLLAQWGQPWSNVSLKKLALSLLKDQLTLALEPGVFNEPVPHLMVYVPTGAPPDRAGIFISDERTPGKSRIIVAQSYELIHDPVQHHIGMRLHNGAVHNQPHDREQYQQISFSTYDLRLSLEQSLYAAVDERPSRDVVLEQLRRSNWTDAGALRRLTEYYKDLAFPVASFIFVFLGIPVGIVSRRSGRIGGFAIGVLIVVLYYVLNMLCDFCVTALMIPPFLGAWLPNTVFLGAALLLFYRMSQR